MTLDVLAAQLARFPAVDGLVFTKIRGTVTQDSEGWVAYLRLEDPPGLSPITTMGRYESVEAAQVATDEVWAAR